MMMANNLLSCLRNEVFIGSYVLLGFLINGLLHLYRFHKVGWQNVTGLWGQDQSIKVSFLLTLWIMLPLVLVNYLLPALKNNRFALLLLPIVSLLVNEFSGRSMLKAIFDILLVLLLMTWLLLEHMYGPYLSSSPSEKALPYVISELMAVFQISLAMLTFIIATFGFSFAPAYIEKYYHQDIGQPTVWWFSAMTVYLALGVLAFISAHSWLMAIKLRSNL